VCAPSSSGSSRHCPCGRAAAWRSRPTCCRGGGGPRARPRPPLPTRPPF
jgi:hypothetical protein